MVIIVLTLVTMVTCSTIIADEELETLVTIHRRVRRQIPRDIKQGCTTTGYEKRLRELCEEILETKCKPVKNVEYRQDILDIYTSDIYLAMVSFLL